MSTQSSIRPEADVRSHKRDLCAHCGLPVPAARISAGAQNQFCCAGCAAVWKILHECELDDYYRLRDTLGNGKRTPARVSGKSFDYLDDPAFLERFGEPLRAGGFRVRFYLDGVHCIACGWLVERVLTERTAARFAALDLGKAVVEIVFSPAEVKLSMLAAALDRIGYTPHPLTEHSGAAAVRRETRSLLARLGIAVASTMNIMLLAVSQYAGDATGIEPGFSSLFRWVSLGLAVPAVLYSAYPYYRSAISGLCRGILHIDLPISLGIVAAFAVSVAATLTGRGDVYYDSVTMLIALLLAGRLVLQRATRWAANASESLLSLVPRTARRIADGSVQEIVLTDVRVGDHLRVLPGETVPVDGTLVGESAWLAEAHLTGESAAVRRFNGDLVNAGSAVVRAPVEIEAAAVGETTRLARLAEMMRTAGLRRAPVTAFLDRIAGRFVVAVLTLALATLLIWLKLDPDRALWNAAALLIVACPCALGLATPVAMGMAMGRAARRGIYIRGQDGVQRLAEIDHVVLDKTGTLTEGKMTIVHSEFAAGVDEQEREHVLSAAGELECVSGHVIATAFQDISPLNPAVENYRVVSGAGVEGTVNGRTFVIGTESLIAERVAHLPPELTNAAQAAVEQGWSPVWIARDGVAVAVLALGDGLHPDAPVAVHRLQAMGFSVELLSGDRPGIADRIAARLGIERSAGGQTPEAKLARIEQLIASGRRVAMAGDGVNDAAALSRATVGISAAGAAEVARDAADVFIAGGRGPAAIPEAIRLAQRTMRIVRINLFIALAYNLTGAALAMTGHVGPLVAAVLMPLSSLTVLLIAARA